MNPVKLLMRGEKLRAKEAASGHSLIDLALMAKEFPFDEITRWSIAAYLLGWETWANLEKLIQGK